MSQNVKKAQNLLIELKSLETCDPVTNRIGTYNLLNEVLKDAEHLAYETIQRETARLLSEAIQRRRMERNFKSRPTVRLVMDNIDIRSANEYAKKYDYSEKDFQSAIKRIKRFSMNSDIETA